MYRNLIIYLAYKLPSLTDFTYIHFKHIGISFTFREKKMHNRDEHYVPMSFYKLFSFTPPHLIFLLVSLYINPKKSFFTHS